MELLAESLRKNRNAHLFIIQYEALGKQPVFESYRRFCNRIGKDVMNYLDYEFWYMRFANGLLDMDHDRSADPKPLMFSELPPEILRHVVDRCDPVSRLATRHVSKQFREIVDEQKLPLEVIEVILDKRLQSVTFYLDGYQISYEETVRGGYVNYCGVTVEIEKGRFLKTAGNDWKALTENRNLNLNELKISIISNEWEEWRELTDVISTSFKENFNIHTFKIQSNESEAATSIIPKLNPESLEGIGIQGCDNLEVLSQSAQWKQAKWMYFFLSTQTINPMILQFFGHFESFATNIPMTIESIMGLLNNLKASANFDKCMLHGQRRFTLRELASAYQTIVQENHTIRLTIPESTTAYLQIWYDGRVLRIERKE